MALVLGSADDVSKAHYTSEDQKYILQIAIESAISLIPGCGGNVWMERVE